MFESMDYNTGLLSWAFVAYRPTQLCALVLAIDGGRRLKRCSIGGERLEILEGRRHGVDPALAALRRLLQPLR